MSKFDIFNVQRSGVTIEKINKDVDGKRDSEACCLKMVESTHKNLSESLMQESGILSSLSHENVVKFYGSNFKGENSYIVMEWMGTDLQKLINEKVEKKENFTKNEIENLLTCLFSGLFFLRTKRIFHGDLKPSNILFDGKTFKLGDFGNSKDFTNTDENIYGNYFLGTPNYWPPEIRNAFLRNDAKSNYNVFKVDSFCLGFSILCAVTLLRPAEIYNILIDKIKRKKLFLDIYKEYSEGITKLLKKITKFDYLKRDGILIACLNYSNYSKMFCLNILKKQNIGLKKKKKEKFELVGCLGKNTEKYLMFAKKTKTRYIMIKKPKLSDQDLLNFLLKFSFVGKEIMQYKYYDIEKTRNDEYDLFLFCEIEKKNNLHDLLLKRQKIKQAFSLSELITLLVQIIKATQNSLYSSQIQLDLKSIFKDQNDNIVFFISDEKKANTGNEVIDLGIILLSLSTLRFIERNDLLEEIHKELFFFNESNIELILKQYGEDFIYLLMEMIRFNENKRIPLSILLTKLEEFKIKCN